MVRQGLLRTLVVLLIAGVFGCGGQPKAQQKPAPAATERKTQVHTQSQGEPPVASAAPSIDDPCAARLHDICGVLLLHVLRQGDLPVSLAELEAAPGGSDLPPLVCPASNRQYVYNPVGIYLPERRARLVVYDPAPSHGGVRWAIIAVEATETDPLICKVIALPESFFVLRPPQ